MAMQSPPTTIAIKPVVLIFIPSGRGSAPGSLTKSFRWHWLNGPRRRIGVTHLEDRRHGVLADTVEAVVAELEEARRHRILDAVDVDVRVLGKHLLDGRADRPGTLRGVVGLIDHRRVERGLGLFVEAQS